MKMKTELQAGKVLSKQTYKINFPSLFFAVLAEIAHPDQRWLLHDVLEDISVPTLTLWGDSDKVRKLSNSKPIYTS